ncbi:putative lipoprotein [Plesiocystis pacifica SIR-1]|uniref:Putative lipoprotein n=1 Tax=Plesiocystis pacifica SIR-1 TaxID=391625 RepID=A6G2F3_9BACT|nr:choice-of-anchor X domain-containing protein [Plesiocystis pacifica]EDM79890.1 putative lipoprotein [Plesiocystis pacifica SIR-1]
MLCMSCAVGMAGCEGAGEGSDSEAFADAALEDFREGEAEALLLPAVQAVELTLLDEGTVDNARLELRFAKGQALEPKIVMELDEGEVVTLRDDGGEGDLEAFDGIYSAIVSFDLGAEAERRLAYLERVEDGSQVTRFRGRNALETQAFEASALDFVFDGEAVAPASLEPQAFVGASLSFPSAPAPMATTTDFEKTLAVRDLHVVQDPTRTGVWRKVGGTCKFTGDAYGSHGFSHLMNEMATPAGVPVETWVQDWLLTYENNQSVNGQTTQSNPSGVAEIWNRFPHTVEDNQVHVFNDTLDLSAPPFQLLAIVNRVDLHEAGVGGNAGELRYVFQLVDPDTCEPMNTTVIFEYEVPITGCSATRSYASSWYDLDGVGLGTPTYNAMLEAITEPVVASGANPNHVTGSALGQLRVNSQTLFWPHYSGHQWHMREYVNTGAELRMQPVAMTPAFAYEYPDTNTAKQPIDDFINTYAADIVAGSYTVEPFYPGTSTPFQGAYAPYGYLNHSRPSPFSGSDVVYFDPFVSASSSVPAWAAPGVINWAGMQRARYWGSHHADLEARHEFSLNTCSGCHGRETFEDAGGLYQQTLTYGVSRSVAGAVAEEPFLHVRAQSPVDAGPAQFSRFMTGTDDGCTTPSGLVAPLGTETCTASCCPVGDPANGPSAAQYHYDDLDRRGQELEAIVHSSCLQMVSASQVHHLQLTPAH